MEITKLVFGGIHCERGGIADKVSSYTDKSMIYADKPFPKGCGKEFFK